MFLEFLLPCLPAIIILASPTAPFVNVCGASWGLSVLGWRRAGNFWSTDKGPSGAFSCLCAVDDVGACPRLRRSPCHSSESTWVACMKGSFGGRYATLDYGAKPPDSFSVEWTGRCCPCVAVGRWPSVFTEWYPWWTGGGGATPSQYRHHLSTFPQGQDCFSKSPKTALAGVVQWLEWQPSD